jgi:hypothetical protein
VAVAYVILWLDSCVTRQSHKMAAVSPLPPSSSKAAGRGKQRRTVSESIDPLYYNQLLDEMRQQQDAGSAYFGNFVYEPRGVPASLLLPSGTPIFQPNTPLPFSQSGPALVVNHALVFERVASEVEKDSAAVRFLMEPPATVRPGNLATNPSSAGKRTGTPFKSPAVTGEPADLKPAVDAVKFIEKAKAHYSSKCAGSGFRCVPPCVHECPRGAHWLQARFVGHNIKPGVSIVSFWTFQAHHN